VCSLENPIIMFYQPILLYLKTFFQQLILRKQMRTLQFEFDIYNPLRSTVTPLQMIGIGIGGTIG
jgi:hypothetical protein